MTKVTRGVSTMELVDAIGFTVGIVGFVWGIVTYVYSTRKSARLYKELRRITWDEIRLASRKLRKNIERSFHPSVVFAPCRRGAAIANLMFDTEENILLHVGIRIDKRTKNAKEFAKSRTDDWKIVETGKYYHYIPLSLINLLSKDKTAKLLILDDYAMTGDSLKGIVDLLLNNGVEQDNLRTAALVCTAGAWDGKGHKVPDFWWLKTTYDEFYFPWGKAV
jgi:hypoxanthine phosphoribosyltransferase